MKKKGTGREILKILLASAVLVVLTYMCVKTGIFPGVGSLIDISFDTILKIIIAVAFIQVVGGVLIVVLSLFKNKSGRVGTMSTVLISIIKYSMRIIGFCWVLTIIGVNVSTIFASIGILALIIGFGAESLVADIVTGVFVLFENEYNIGDIIEVDGFRGTVTEIGIRTVSVQDSGGNIKIINNSDLKNIINRSNQKSTAVCDIGVAYETDLEEFDKLVIKIIDEIIGRNPEVFKSGIKYLGVQELGDFSITMRFAAEAEENKVFATRRLLNKELKTAFDRHNVSIPFPQIEVRNR